MGQPFDIVGYVYKADTWCEECVLHEAVADYGASHFLLTSKNVEYSLEVLGKRKGINTEDEYSYDSDEFPKVMFRESEGLDFCANCGELLETSWGGEEVNRAREMLYEYVNRYMDDDLRNANACDSVREHLGWCIVDDKDERVMQVYDAVRDLEDV